MSVIKRDENTVQILAICVIYALFNRMSINSWQIISYFTVIVLKFRK